MTATCQIDAILAAICALAPTYDTDATITTRDYDEQRSTLTSASCPVRIVMPLISAGEQFGFVALGNTISITWRIVDRLYFKPVVEGGGLRDVTKHLVTYCASYVNAIRAKRAPTATSHIVSASFTPGVFEWANEQFFGVDVVLDIEEFIAGA